MQYNKPNVQNLQNYLNNSKSGDQNDIKWWSFPQGTSVIRILPPWDATGMVALEVYQHRIEYTEPGSSFTKYSWTCVERTFGKPCNICRGLKEMRDAGINTEDWDPTTRQFYINALVMSDPNYGRIADALAPGTHVLMRIPKTVYDWVVSCITNPQIGDITDVTSGLDIMVTKSGSGLDTRYACTMTPNGRTPIDPAILSNLELYNLTEIFSSGFDDQRIASMIASIKNSALRLNNMIPNVQMQMNPQQYQQPQMPVTPQYPTMPQTPQVPQVPQTPPVPQVPQVPQTPQVPVSHPVVPQYNPQPVAQPAPVAPAQMMPQSTPVPPSPYLAGQPVIQPQIQPAQAQIQPAPIQAGTPPVQSQQAQTTPTCYGQYNPADVNCITCPYEVDCTRASNH